MRVTGVLAFVLVACSLFVGLKPPETRTEVIARAHKYAHKIEELDENGSVSGQCSATAIGAHMLLTATHCAQQGAAEDYLVLDGYGMSEDLVKVKGLWRDNADHTIYGTDRKFADYATVNTSAKIVPGQVVFYFGNPGKYENFFREGHVVQFYRGYPETKDLPAQPSEIYLDINGFHGDSGAGIFNEQGELIAVMNYGNELDTSYDNITAKFMQADQPNFPQVLFKYADIIGEK